MESGLPRREERLITASMCKHSGSSPALSVPFIIPQPPMNIHSSQEAADDLGITRTRLLRLLIEGRVKGAKKIGRDWVIPTPIELIPGSRGPAGVAGRKGKKRR